MKWKVVWSKKVEKQIKCLPRQIQVKLRNWVVAVEVKGLPVVRQVPGFHDEPLQGVRFGQRSVRLNRAYRLIYLQNAMGEMQIIEVIEVNRHDY